MFPRLFILLVVTLITRLVYVFYFTDYKNYLVSDMGGYWSRAIERYDGNIFSIWQWTSWSTFFYFYLVFVFKVLHFIGLANYRLEAVLFLNIIFSTISVLLLYFIANYIFKNSDYSLLVAGFYAFCYPLLYLNALVLSENLSIPILMFSVYLLFAFNENKLVLFLNGLFLGVVVASRPALGFLGLPFFLYIVFSNKTSVGSFLKGILFASGFFATIFAVIVENNYISKGEMKSLAGNGGLGFYIAQCKPSIVKSVYKGVHVHVGAPNYYGKAGHVEVDTDHPIHDQKYFFELGLDCIKKNPYVLVENLKEMRGTFLGPLFPTLLSAKGFKLFMDISNCMVIFMFLSLALLYYLLRGRQPPFKNILFLLSIPFCILLVSYFFIPEQRYFFPAYFAIYLLFFYIVFNLKKIKKEAINYFKILVISLVVLYLYFR